MLRIISSLIRDFVERLAKDSILNNVDQILSRLDPQGEKQRDIKTVLTFNLDDRGLSTIKYHVDDGLKTVTKRISGYKQNTGPSAPDAIKILEECKELYTEASKEANKAKGSEENQGPLNNVAKNIVLVKDRIEKSQPLLQKALMNK